MAVDVENEALIQSVVGWMTVFGGRPRGVRRRVSPRKWNRRMPGMPSMDKDEGDSPILPTSRSSITFLVQIDSLFLSLSLFLRAVPSENEYYFEI